MARCVEHADDAEGQAAPVWGQRHGTHNVLPNDVLHDIVAVRVTCAWMVDSAEVTGMTVGTINCWDKCRFLRLFIFILQMSRRNCHCSLVMTDIYLQHGTICVCTVLIALGPTQPAR